MLMYVFLKYLQEELYSAKETMSEIERSSTSVNFLLAHPVFFIS